MIGLAPVYMTLPGYDSSIEGSEMAIVWIEMEREPVHYPVAIVP